MVLQEEVGCYVLSQVPRPVPEEGAEGAGAPEAQRSMAELAQALDTEALSEAKDKLELFITETQDIGVSALPRPYDFIYFFGFVDFSLDGQAGAVHHRDAGHQRERLCILVS
jgi:hypothetical protein